MPLFLDASALAKRYLPEGISSQTVKEVVSRSSEWGGSVVSAIIRPEVVSAVAAKVRGNSLPVQRRAALTRMPAVVAAFHREYGNQTFRILPVTEVILDDAARLIAAKPTLNIGAADAIHLATAIEVRDRLAEGESLVFVTADRGLAEAAEGEDFPVFDPLYHRTDRLDEIRGLRPAR
ncbi:MAG TPA: type II toxin-antitoxin system VapC family toxin [Longimicrobium sp.]|jgi:predicted nucleic acid-binding protein|nr:type II toxin-antitoxin system VapC family toxin [Longimicrobium sp.]